MRHMCALTAKRASTAGFSPLQMSSASQSSYSNDTDIYMTFTPATSHRGSTQHSLDSTNWQMLARPYKHAYAAYRMLTWPAIQQPLTQFLASSTSDMKVLEQDGSVFIVHVHREMPGLLLSKGL